MARRLIATIFLGLGLLAGVFVALALLRGDFMFAAMAGVTALAVAGFLLIGERLIKVPLVPVDRARLDRRF